MYGRNAHTSQPAACCSRTRRQSAHRQDLEFAPSRTPLQPCRVVMGCAASTTQNVKHADSDLSGAQAAKTNRISYGTTARSLARSTMSNSSQTVRSGRRRSDASSGSRSAGNSGNRSSNTSSRTSRRRSSQGLFRRFSYTHSANDMDKVTVDADPLDLGSNTKVVKAPSQWLVFMGQASCGKSTLVRQLKFAHEGSDASDAARFTREVHKLAVDLIKGAASQVAPQLKDAGARLAAERIQALGRRAQVGADVAADVRTLWQSPEIARYESELADVQRLKACKHFVQRIDELAQPEYVPEPLDLLHVAIPTVGRAETRVPSFPGGELTLIELSPDTDLSPFGGQQAGRMSTAAKTDAPNAENNLFGPGLRGVVFTASAVDFEVQPDAYGAPKAYVPTRVLSLWRKAQLLAQSRAVPCYLVLSKRDLLEHLDSSLRGGISASSVDASLRSQFLANPSNDALALASAPIADGDAPPRSSLTSGKPARNSQQSATNPLASASCALSVDALDAQGDVAQLNERIIAKSFPELDFDEDDSSTLSGSVHICLAYFGSSADIILSKGGALPVIKWQSNALPFADHMWLHELPDPLPNPLRATSDDALLMGKNSPIEARASFWNAICSLTDKTGLAEVDTLGALHVCPLLTVNGALMIVFRRDFHATPQFSALPKGIKWRPAVQVAWKMSTIAKATELHTYHQQDNVHSSAQSYSTDVRDMLAATPAKDLHPSVWLGKLRNACAYDDPAMLSPGTYVVAFYTRSNFDGLQLLMPVGVHPSMPPYAKISDAHLSASEWSQLCQLGIGTEVKGQPPNIPVNWAAAKAWMGPEVGSEKQFTPLQKFFYGVVALRQRLERKCTATQDDLRYSQTSGAAESLAALGGLYTKEIILADPEGKVQLIVVARHLDASQTEAFPNTLHWLPVAFFEAHCFRRFLPSVHRAVCISKQVLSKALTDQRVLEGKFRMLRVSRTSSHAGSDDMNHSGLRDSTQPSAFGRDSHSCVEAPPPCKQDWGAMLCNTAITENIFGQADEKALDEIFRSLRWTQRVVLTACAEWLSGDRLRTSRMSKMNPNQSLDHKVCTAKQRMQQHAKAYQGTVKALRNNTLQMRKRATRIEALVQQMVSQDPTKAASC